MRLKRCWNERILLVRSDSADTKEQNPRQFSMTFNFLSPWTCFRVLLVWKILRYAQYCRLGLDPTKWFSSNRFFALLSMTEKVSSYWGFSRSIFLLKRKSKTTAPEESVLRWLHKLYSFQSCEAWLCKIGKRLAIFDIFKICKARVLWRKLVQFQSRQGFVRIIYIQNVG